MISPAQITKGGGFAIELSSCRAINADSTRVLVLASHPGSVLDYFALYATNGTFIKELPIRANEEPRWDRTARGSLYFVRWNRLMLHNPEDGQTATVHVFEEYVEFTPDGRNGVSGKGESDVSLDGDVFALSGVTPGGRVDVFSYSLKNGKGPVYSQTIPFDGLKLAGNSIILSRDDGIWVLPESLDTQLTSANGHACTVQYSGRDFLVWNYYGDTNDILIVDIETGASRVLLSFDKKHYACHLSPGPGFVLVSAYDDTNELPIQIWKVLLDGSATLLCQPPGMIRDYSSQPHASLSQDGTMAVFTLDDGEQTNVWMIRLDELPVIKPITPIIEIDYSPYAGKSEFVIEPQAKCVTCGSTVKGISERKL